ncbi:PepSY domain-containing protein [uncultured Oscillibacter sp.]|uniref:PepSY domain-containing protein n=1 Tax=uncultured Oscillibacter sp. TaxID=876091 RepID=UPI0025FE6C64|nr:PepSY domain-containing protein [uncultured Oscillibacter sp.]
MDSQKHETIEKRMIRWLIIATLALLVLVLGLRAWQLVRSGTADAAGRASTQDAQAVGPAGSPDAGPSPGKSALIEAVRDRNDTLSAEELSALSTEELEQLWTAGAPGMPIGSSAAAQAAEEHAGTLEADAVTWDVDPELDETPACYEVELHHITLGDFEYKIDAYTGEVLEGEADILRSVYVPAPGSGDPAGSGGPAPEEAPAGASVPADTGAGTGEEAAKAAAFAHAGVAGEDVSAVEAELDWDDGVRIYEIEFRAGGIEYDYEIEADTGAVRKAGQEWGGGSAPRPSGGEGPALIGESAAQAAALAHAGVRAGDAGYLRGELDEDDGVWVYEIEFTADGVEYDYEIDAVSGAVRKAEQER